MNESHPPVSAVAARFEEEIGALAHSYYEDEGRPEGLAQDHWLRAEQQIRARHESEPAPETAAGG